MLKVENRLHIKVLAQSGIIEADLWIGVENLVANPDSLLVVLAPLQFGQLHVHGGRVRLGVLTPFSRHFDGGRREHFDRSTRTLLPNPNPGTWEVTGGGSGQSVSVKVPIWCVALIT